MFKKSRTIVTHFPEGAIHNLFKNEPSIFCIKIFKLQGFKKFKEKTIMV